jgi:hypothetical protein
MPGVAGGTGANRSIGIWFADAVALGAATRCDASNLQTYEGVLAALAAASMKLLGKSHLLRGKIPIPVYRCPGWCCVPTAQELLIGHFMTATAVRCRHGLTYGESVVFLWLLILTPLVFVSRCRLVAIEAIDTFLGMNTHFIFMNDGVLLVGVTLCAFAAGLDEGGTRLIGLRLGPLPLNEKRADDQPKSDHQRDEY